MKCRALMLPNPKTRPFETSEISASRDAVSVCDNHHVVERCRIGRALFKPSPDGVSS